MRSYEKRILTIPEQVSELKSAKMIIESDDVAAKFLSRVEYYRFRGYSFQFYDNSKKEYKENTKFSDIVAICDFDAELSHLLFAMLSSIEVSLRSRLVDALLTYKEDTLILYDPAIFDDKKNYWSNNGSLSQEIARSSDVFIKHNFDKHDGNVPVWAAVEIMSFGTLSKTIKNLKTGCHCPGRESFDFSKHCMEQSETVSGRKCLQQGYLRIRIPQRGVYSERERIPIPGSVHHPGRSRDCSDGVPAFYKRRAELHTDRPEAGCPAYPAAEQRMQTAAKAEADCAASWRTKGRR